MFLIKQRNSEAYWNSYRLLEKQFIKLSHSITFDDNQINVYSSELTDIISSACIKIESLAKDIYEDHICPFQLDNGVVPKSFLKGQKIKDVSKFNPEKWTRNHWKYDYNCLVEINEMFSISNKFVNLKIERFNFLKYGSSLLPFYNVTLDNCKGGKWEYNDFNLVSSNEDGFQDIDWCKYYQEIKHNYIESIAKYGTVKNAIMVLAAFYLLCIYCMCLPAKQFDFNSKSNDYGIDFNSQLFFCSMCNYTIPPFIKNDIHNGIKSEHLSHSTEQIKPDRLNVYPFLVVLKKDIYNNLQKVIDEYCATNKEQKFNFEVLKANGENDLFSPEAKLYQKICRFIYPPYNINNVSIAFNTGAESVYNYLEDNYDYDKSKFANRNKKVLSTLQVGDFVDAKFIINDVVTHGLVKKITQSSIDISLINYGQPILLSEPIGNIIYIKKSKKQT